MASAYGRTFEHMQENIGVSDIPSLESGGDGKLATIASIGHTKRRWGFEEGCKYKTHG
jgi:hypothetical protein